MYDTEYDHSSMVHVSLRQTETLYIFETHTVQVFVACPG